MPSAKLSITIHFFFILLCIFVSLPTYADDDPKTITTEDNKNISLQNVVELEDVLKNSEYLPLFFEARMTKNKHVLKFAPKEQSETVLDLDPLVILKIDMTFKDYSDRKNDEADGVGRWRSISVNSKNTNENTNEKLYFYDKWDEWKMIRLSSEMPSLTYVGPKNSDVILYKNLDSEDTNSCNNDQTICLKEIPSNWQVQLVDTLIYRDKNGKTHLRYKIQFNYADELDRVFTYEAYSPAKNFVRSTDHFEIMQHACIPIEKFRDKSRPMKEIFADLDLLPKRRVAIQRLDKGLFSLVKNKSNSRNYGRFVKTKLVQEGASAADITVVREEIEIKTLYGGNIGFQQVDLDHRTAYSHVSFHSENVNLSAYSYLPLFSDLELSVRGSISIPTHQLYRDEIKNLEEKISDVYQLYVGQLFHFRYQADDSERKTNLGFGLSYRALLGTNAIQFGFDSLIGVSLVASIEWPKFILGGRYEPIANNFNVDIRNRDLELNFAYKLTNREFEPNWSIFTRVLDIEYHGQEQNSTLKSNEYFVGVGLGY